MTSSFANIVIIMIVVLIVGLDIVYIYRSRKKGKCIGCPYSDGTCTRCVTGKDTDDKEKEERINV